LPVRSCLRNARGTVSIREKRATSVNARQHSLSSFFLVAAAAMSQDGIIAGRHHQATAIRKTTSCKRSIRCFPEQPIRTRSGLIGAPNSIGLFPNLCAVPLKGATVTVGSSFFWRQSTRDGIYSINAAPLRTGQLSSARCVGAQPSVRIDWLIQRHCS
jgi:hypothetical protein